MTTVIEAQEKKFFISASSGTNIIGPFNESKIERVYLNDNTGFGFAIIEIEDAILYFTSSLKGGYFINKNFAVGLNIDYAFESRKSKNNESTNYKSTIKVNNYVISPFFRYYFKNRIFLQSQIGLGKQNNQIEITGNDPFINNTESTFSYRFKNNIETMGVGIGYSLLLKKNLTFDPFLNYVITTGKVDDVEQYTFFKRKLYLNLGITYSF